MGKQEPGRRLSSRPEEGRDSGTLELPTGCAGNSGGVARGHHVLLVVVTVWVVCFSVLEMLFWVILIPVSNPSSTPHPTRNVVPFLGWVDVYYISPGKAFTTHIYLHPGNRRKNSKGNSNSNFKQTSICHPNILSRSWLRLFTKRSTSLEDPVFLPWHSIRLMLGLSAGSRAVQGSTVC